MKELQEAYNKMLLDRDHANFDVGYDTRFTDAKDTSEAVFGLAPAIYDPETSRRVKERASDDLRQSHRAKE